MASVTQALELCLKAVAAHASFREGKGFKVAAGHGVNRLYDALPDPLQDEIASESRRLPGIMWRLGCKWRLISRKSGIVTCKD